MSGFVTYPADMDTDQGGTPGQRELLLTLGDVDTHPWEATDPAEMEILSRYFHYDPAQGKFSGYVAEDNE